MKKNRIFILGIVTMFVAILSLTLVSGTLARYTSTGTGTGSVEVAKWDVQINGNQLVNNPGATNTTFNLFSTTTNYDELGDDVVDGKIAPGTQGSFSFVLTNASEVTANYAIDYDIDEAGVPLEWSLTGDPSSWTTDLADVAADAGTVLAKEVGSKTIVVYWRWIFDGDDEVDTDLGLNGAEPTVTINVTFTQVD